MKKYLHSLALLLGVCLALLSCGQTGNTPPEPSDSGAEVLETSPGTEALPAGTKAVNLVSAPPENALFQKDNTYFVVSPTGIPNGGELFVDHSIENRSGHFGHAMVEYADGKILDFYPNCNTDNNGHSGRGWMEYKRSEDYGATWSAPIILPYSYNTYMNSAQKRSIICEKAVVADDGTIILFCLQCDVDSNALWEPYFEPTYITSRDGGETWSEPTVLNEKNGRVYAVLKYRGGIYVLAHLKSNEDGKYHYYIYCSKDNGLTFAEKRNTVPIPDGCFYGTMEVLPDDSLIVYGYSEDDETRLFYSVSETNGLYWTAAKTAYFARCIRNPQMICLNGAYFMMGRSGQETGNNIIYFSTDGIHWDNGHFLSLRTAGLGAYSNAILVGTFNDNVPNRILYQASKAYYKSQTNVLHWWIDAYVVSEEAS